ncbi:zinc finger BED domain-containing protein RICESLEEPER 2-like [Lactuca sativa]|uniref:zinc finger BED domain-containing protein RICESLEEPER 2-like n=1 Tax=Lactuca sativa TaxID=4236 RepID=UPI000CD838AF|nr:zinc finger BED domain-containing protein RICESLEEPER 2-like [Lactuca sativa]
MEKMKEKLRPDNLLLKGELLHMKCCAHILSLIFQQGLSAIQSGIESIRESVVFWTATPKRVEKFEETKDGVSLSSKRKLVLDCKTRWNSTYLMLMSAIPYKEVFNSLIHKDKSYKQAPSDHDWLLAKVMCEKLKLFYSVTEMFSGVRYPTANLFFPKICEIRMLLQECSISPYAEIKRMATNMAKKFEQYWSLIHGVLALATILNPGFKMKLIEYYFPKMYGDESPLEVERLRKLTYDLVKEYKPCDAKETDFSLNISDFGMDVDDCGDPLAGFDLFVSTTSTVDTYKSELDYYLEENVLPRTGDFDILAWWKANGLKYPTLQRVVRDVLAIHVSTVASESAFSTGGRHVTPHRNRLHPDTLEALICVQDWLRDEKLGSIF